MSSTSTTRNKPESEGSFIKNMNLSVDVNSQRRDGDGSPRKHDGYEMFSTP
jgi:hypothetical protein